MQQNVGLILTQNWKPLVMQGIVIMHLNQFRLQSYQTKKNHLEKVHSVINHNIDISNYSPF